MDFLLNPTVKWNIAKNYISRLKEIDTKINQLLDDLNYRESIGIIPPLFSLEKCEKQISDFLSENPKENVLVVSLDKKISDIKTITNKEKYISKATGKSRKQFLTDGFDMLYNQLERCISG